MTFAANWETVPVTGRFIEIDADPVEGRIIFTPTPTHMIDAKDLTTVVQSEYWAQLDALGRFLVNLPATDDPDITPVEFTYKVVEDWPGGSTYFIEVPHIYADLGIDISALAQVDANPGLPVEITREEFDALAMQVEMLLGTVEGGDASSTYYGEGLNGGGVLGVEI